MPSTGRKPPQKRPDFPSNLAKFCTTKIQRGTKKVRMILLCTRSEQPLKVHVEAIMLAMHYVLNMFPEITIKSRPVRQRMVAQLRQNLLRLLKPVDAQIEVIKEWDRIQVVSHLADSEQARIVDVLSRTPGICNFLQVVDYPWVDMRDAYEKTRALFGEQIKGKTFAVRCKRSGKHTFTSTEV